MTMQCLRMCMVQIKHVAQRRVSQPPPIRISRYHRVAIVPCLERASEQAPHRVFGALKQSAVCGVARGVR